MTSNERLAIDLLEVASDKPLATAVGAIAIAVSLVDERRRGRLAKIYHRALAEGDWTQGRLLDEVRRCIEAA